MIEDAWKNFELSGKISDYLTYRQGTERTGCGQGGEAAHMERGIGSYGAERNSDGYGVKCHADGRV